MKISKGRVIFNILNYMILISLCLTIILPFMHIASISLSNAKFINEMSVGIWPKGIELQAYKEILESKVFLRSFFNTVFITATATILSLIVGAMAAYVLSKKFYGKKVINYIFIITMYFSGGLIPTFLLISKYLGWYNNYLALIIPGLLSVFYIIIIRTQIQAIPASLTEAAFIDGATEGQTLFHVVLPCITNTLAAIGMFTVLGHWNSWFNVMIYSDKRELWTLQYYLRSVVLAKSFTINLTDAMAGSQLIAENVVEENYQMAAIILVALPVICIYPFIQKYFVKGVLTGAVKE